MRKIIFLAGVQLAGIYAVPFPAEVLARERVTPARIWDRHGRLLWEDLAPDQSRGRWVPLSEISPWLIRATLAAEDRRFYRHLGIDPFSTLRAARDNLASGRRVSGASTLTMQLVRLLKPQPRTWSAKWSESVWALRLELALSKDEILEEYLNRAPYGGNVIGVEAGAQRVFGKPARDLSPAEAALLAGLPQCPARLDPLRFPERARKRQQWILSQMQLDPDTYQRALAEELRFLRPRVQAAPSYGDWARGRTTLDADLQHDVEGIVRNADLAHAGASEAAVVVMEHHEVRAFVGPALRRRSPGSALKPFVYALALRDGKTDTSVYDDRPIQLESKTGAYVPRNYDGRFYGPVTLRQALANSLNIPAVLALRDVGVARFAAYLRDLGFEGIEPRGLGLILGDARVSPLEMARAYSTLARTEPLIADILAADDARALAFGTGTDLCFDVPVAAKTGTSADHRDNWVAGFTRRYTVVVWVGNPDGRPLRGTSGLEGAGPIFRAVILRLADAGIERLGRSHDIPETMAEFRVECPGNNDRFLVDGPTFLVFRATSPAAVEWFLDGRLLAATSGNHCVPWPVTLGTHELRVRSEGRELLRRFVILPR